MKLGETSGSDGIPNECLRQLPRRTPFIFNDCVQLGYFPATCKDAGNTASTQNIFKTIDVYQPIVH
jgi:hypothetical protein